MICFYNELMLHYIDREALLLSSILAVCTTIAEENNSACISDQNILNNLANPSCHFLDAHSSLLTILWLKLVTHI